MANQRKKGKVLVRAYLTQEERDLVFKIAKSNGKTVSDLIREIANENKQKNQK